MTHATVSPRPSAAHGTAAGSEVFEALKSRLADRLERLSAEVLALRRQSSSADDGAPVTAEAEATHRAIEARMRLLGQLASGLADVVPAALPVGGVGYGSTVALEDLEEGGREEYTLVTGKLIDPDAGQVSLASPVGQALLGRCVGDRVEILTPQKLRRVRITALRTIHERLGMNGRPPRALPEEA